MSDFSYLDTTSAYSEPAIMKGYFTNSVIIH